VKVILAALILEMIKLKSGGFLCHFALHYLIRSCVRILYR